MYWITILILPDPSSIPSLTNIHSHGFGISPRETPEDHILLWRNPTLASMISDTSCGRMGLSLQLPRIPSTGPWR